MYRCLTCERDPRPRSRGVTRRGWQTATLLLILVALPVAALTPGLGWPQAVLALLLGAYVIARWWH